MAQKRESGTTRRPLRCARPGCTSVLEPGGRARHQIYCSPACRVGAFQGRPKVELRKRACTECGVLFMPDRATARFCSPECRWAYNSGKAIRRRPRRAAPAAKGRPRAAAKAGRKAPRKVRRSR